MNKIKPKIKFKNGIWICEGIYVSGFGNTPLEAWVSFHYRQFKKLKYECIRRERNNAKTICNI